MRSRLFLPAAVLYLFGVLAASAAYFASYLLAGDATAGSILIQRFLVGMAIVSLGLIVPLRYWMEKRENDLFFTKRHLETMQNRLAIREEDATLLTRINELTERFSETRNLEGVLHGAVSILKEVLHVRILVLQLYSHQDSRFFMRIEDGTADLDLGAELYEDVIEKGKSRLVNNLDSTPEYGDLARRGFRSLLVAPLCRWGRGGSRETIGLVAAISEERRDFTAHDQFLMTAFAKQAGVIIENAQLYEKTEAMAVRDGLTNLFNYRRFKERLEEELAKCRTEGRPLALLMGDIDFFKHYNDRHGHQAGDGVLRGVAEVLLRSTRGADIVARYGGEEFVIILPGTEAEGARAVGENVRRRVAEERFPGEEEQPNGDLTITLGLAVFPRDGGQADEVIESADQALYEGKRTGRNRLVVYGEMAGPAAAAAGPEKTG
jgi:diguanylate cyclase (GGDEF)-like protein